jgi:hypothetical protein
MHLAGAQWSDASGAKGLFERGTPGIGDQGEAGCILGQAVKRRSETARKTLHPI